MHRSVVISLPSNQEPQDRMNPLIRILPLPSTFSESGWAGREQGNFLSLGRETVLEGEVDQRHEDLERKREYYFIIIFPEWKLNLWLTAFNGATPVN